MPASKKWPYFAMKIISSINAAGNARCNFVPLTYTYVRPAVPVAACYDNS